MENDYLKHVGILGMKWGHRKASDSSSGAGQKRPSRDEVTAAKRREESQKLVDDLVGHAKKSAAKKGRVYTKEQEDADRKWAENFFSDDLHMTAQGIKNERVRQGTVLAASALMLIGTVALNRYVGSLGQEYAKKTFIPTSHY